METSFSSASKTRSLGTKVTLRRSVIRPPGFAIALYPVGRMSGCWGEIAFNKHDNRFERTRRDPIIFELFDCAGPAWTCCDEKHVVAFNSICPWPSTVEFSEYRADSRIFRSVVYLGSHRQRHIFNGVRGP